MKNDYFLGHSEEGFHKVAYIEWGISSNYPPIICVHGLTRNSHDFDALAAYLSAAGRQAFCPDIVGRGNSDWLKNALHYTYEQYIADMTVMIARTQAKEVDWVGTSMGGLIGMIIAATSRSPIRRLVLNDIGPRITTKALARLSRYAGRDPDFSSFEAAKSYFKTIYSEFGSLTEGQWDHLTETSIRQIGPHEFISKIDHGVKVSPAKSKIAWNALLHPHKALEGTLFDIDLWSIWRNINCPVLVIHGQHSDILLASTIQKMKEIHPATEVFEVPNTGHAPALLSPEQHEVIEHFLR